MFDRWDVCEAYYLFGCLWHGGRSTKAYGYLSRLSALGFCPGRSLNARRDLSENGRYVYDRLVRRRAR